MTSLASAQSARLAKRKAPKGKEGSTADTWRPATDLQKSARQPAKRLKTSSEANLDGWLGVSTAIVPNPIVSSKEIIAQDSTFLAHAAPVDSKAAALAFREHIRREHAQDPASHEMLAWRCMNLIEGRDGASPADFTVASGGDEDGEKWSVTHLQKALEETNSIDVAVVCSRWFGGELLGPVRFQHIRTVAKDAIANLQVALELDTLREHLLVKDARIAEMAPTSPGKTPNYADLDVAKAKRLLLARDKRLAFLEGMVKKKDDQEPDAGGFVREEEAQ